MKSTISTPCLAKMLTNATWAYGQALRLGIEPLIEKYGKVINRLRPALRSRMEVR